jgi:hypothetical protein
MKPPEATSWNQGAAWNSEEAKSAAGRAGGAGKDESLAGEERSARGKTETLAGEKTWGRLATETWHREATLESGETGAKASFPEKTRKVAEHIVDERRIRLTRRSELPGLRLFRLLNREPVT